MIGRTRFDIPAVVVCLFLAATTGAAAQDQPGQTDRAPVTVELASELCTVDIERFGGSFGVWEWSADQDAYVETSGQSTGYLNVVITSDSYRCDVTGRFSGLTGPGPGGDRIDPSHFTLRSSSSGTAVTVPTDSWMDNDVPGRTAYTLELTVDSVPSNIPPGRYSGPIVVTVVNSR